MKWLILAARSLRREFQHGELRTLAAALLLAVAALTAVVTLSQRVERALLASAAELIGGDLGVSARHAIPADLPTEATRLGLSANESADFPSVVFAGEKSQLAQVVASDTRYPLRGVLSVRDAQGAEHETHAPEAGTAYADHALLAALGLQVGDSLQLAGRSLRIGGEISRQPDGGQFFSLAPRLLIALGDARDAGLLGAGSRARHKLMLSGNETALAAFSTFAKAHLPEGGELVTVAEAQQNMRSAFDRGEAFLRLAALLSALLSGIAVALAAQRYARRKTDEVALLRALGASRNEVLVTLSLGLLLLAIPACLLGAALGLGLQAGVLAYAQSLLPSAAPAASLMPALAALGVGVAVLVGFALPPLARLRDVPPVRVFQRAVSSAPRRFDLLYLLPPLVAIGLIRSLSGSARIASALSGSLIGVVIVSLLVGVTLLWLLRRGAGVLPGALRFGLANLARRRTLSLIQTTALSLSFTALMLLGIVGPGLLNAWRADLPADTPNHFLINLQPEQRSDVEKRLADVSATHLNTMPLAVGKLVAINGKTPRAEDFKDRRAASWINGETRVSWSDALPPANKLLEGAWFAPQLDGPEVSVDRTWVDMFHLKLGDTLSLSVGEKRLDAKISSIREVDWSSFRVNFFLMLDPASAQALPHSVLASFYLPPGHTAGMAALSRDYPNLSLIDVDAILDRVRDIIARVTKAVVAVLGFSLAAGLLVLIAALGVSADERRFESALLRTLGAGRGQLLAAVLGEFVLLGLIAAVIGAAGAIAAGLALGSAVFKIAWVPPALPFGIAVLGATALVAMAGWLGTRRVAQASPLLVLRRE